MAVPRSLPHQGVSVFTLMLCAIGMTTAVEAQGLFGRSDVQQYRGTPANRPADSSAARDVALMAQSDQAASQLLVTARRNLSDGHTELAQRVLEHLVASHPAAPAATEARRDLYALYSRDRSIAAGVPPQPQAPPPAEARAPADTLVSSWRTSIKSFRRLQDELRNSVGDRIFFSAGSAELGTRARAVIASQANWLQHRPDLDVQVDGHADDTDVGADDEALSATRAEAVRNRLIAEGVAPESVRVAAQGARDPVAMCGDSNCAAQNRRVVLQIGLRRSQTDGNQPAAGPARTALPEVQR